MSFTLLQNYFGLKSVKIKLFLLKKLAKYVIGGKIGFL